MNCQTCHKPEFSWVNLKYNEQIHFTVGLTTEKHSVIHLD